MTKIVNFDQARKRVLLFRDKREKLGTPQRGSDAHILELARALIYSTAIEYDLMLANEIYDLLWQRFQEDASADAYLPITKKVDERLASMDPELLIQWMMPYELDKET